MSKDQESKKTSLPGITPPKPIPIKDRASMLFLEKGQVDVIDGAFVLIDKDGIRTQIPVGGIACLLLEPGIRISHAACALAGRVGCLIIWVGEAAVRLYSAGQPGGARSGKLLYQAKLALDEKTRLNVVRRMYDFRFGESAPERRSIEQLRGIEGARVKQMYKNFANMHGVSWHGRKYDPGCFDRSDLPNMCLSEATSCLYGICEAAILAAGYAPAIGFLHTGKARSFVYDIADLFKFETVVPTAFKIAGKAQKNIEPFRSDPSGEVRRACRDSFREAGLLKKIIPTIEEVLGAGGIEPPTAHEEAMPIAIEEEASGDDGHRG